MKDAPSPPPPPDPTVVANAQAQANQQTALQQQKLNMVNTSSPYGSVNYTEDPTAPGGYRQTTTLSPTQQGIYDASTQAEQGAAQTAADQIARVRAALGKSIDPASYGTLIHSVDPNTGAVDRQAVTDAVYGQAKSRLDPEFQIAQTQLADTLANQGIGINSAAWKNAMDQFGRTRNDAYNQANFSAIQQGANEQATKYNEALQNAGLNNNALNEGFQQGTYAQNLPINQLTGLLGLSPVQGPQGINYTPSSVAPTDVTGAYALNANVANQNYQQQMQNQGDLFGGLLKLGGSILAAPMTGGGSLIGNFLGR